MCLPGFELTTFSTPSKPNESQRVWTSSSLHTSAQVLLPSELSGLHSCTFWNVSALTCSLRATDVQKVFGRIQMPNPLFWQDLLLSELTLRYNWGTLFYLILSKLWPSASGPMMRDLNSQPSSHQATLLPSKLSGHTCAPQMVEVLNFGSNDV